MEGNNIKSFENLCKIFEMRIKLDKEKNNETPKTVLDNYEKYTKRIDSIYNEEFEKELRLLISPAKDINAEKERLEKLISLVSDRLEKRSELEDRYYSVTGNYSLSLQAIVSDSELEEKKKRLATIDRYLNNKSEINDIKDSISELEKLLEEEENKKKDYIVKNKRLEEELYNSFIAAIKEDEDFNNITKENIDEEISKIIPVVKESKETLDVTKDSIETLISSGINDDYNSYIEEASKSYYSLKNKELCLKIFKLVLNTEEDFNEIFAKRERISSLLEERKELIKELEIKDLNMLSSFEDKLLEQTKTVDEEEKVIENISNHASRIKFKKARLEELEEDNNNVEVLSILREYNLVETYDNEEFNEKESIEEIKPEEDSIIKDEINPYRIKEILDAPPTLNLGLARLKGEAVREKVNKKLNPEKIEIITSPEINNQISEDNIPTWNMHLPEEISNGGVTSEVASDNVVDPTSEENIPTWNIPTSEENTNNNEMTQETTKELENQNLLPEQSIPVWNIPVQEQVETINNDTPAESIPTWNNVTPTFDNNIENTNSLDSNVNNIFWTPISDEKLENGSFPNIDMSSFNQEVNSSINIPISDDNQFPDLN